MESDVSKYDECQSKMNYNNNTSSVYQDATSKMNSYLVGTSIKFQKGISDNDNSQNKIDYNPELRGKNNNENIDTNCNSNEKNFKEEENQNDDIKDKDLYNPSSTRFELESNKKGACCELPKCIVF